MSLCLHLVRPPVQALVLHQVTAAHCHKENESIQLCLHNTPIYVPLFPLRISSMAHFCKMGNCRQDFCWSKGWACPAQEHHCWRQRLVGENGGLTDSQDVASTNPWRKTWLTARMNCSNFDNLRLAARGVPQHSSLQCARAVCHAFHHV